jgi:chromosome segregation ATPase
LEEQLEKAGPEYNSAALKENTELKVLRLTMQRDISRYKKSLQQAERDLEDYQQQLIVMRDKARRRQTDEEVQREMDLMREEIESRDNELRELREELRLAKDSQSQEIEKLRDDVEDLEATVREKDRAIDERDEELEELRENRRENDAGAELQLELERAKEQIQELQDELEQVRSEAQEADAAVKNALDEKNRAEDDLRELQDEMADKSFTTRGLSRQLEERADKLEEEVQDLRQANDNLRAEVDSKTETVTRLEERYQTAQQDLRNDAGKLGEDLESARRERDLLRDELERTSAQLQEALDNVQRRTEEKELLQTRHHALTDESGGLQSELTRAQSRIRELQKAVEEATTRAQDNQNQRWQHKVEIDRLQDEIEALQHEIEDKEGHFALEQDRWESAKRTLQSQRERAEEQAAGFKRTIEKLQETEHTLSGKEFKLQGAIDSEKQRHLQEEAVLNRQIKDLGDELTQKRDILDEQRNDLLTVREELRLSRREEQSLKEKVQALEDEVIVLQSSLADEQEYAKGRMQKGSSEVEVQLQRAISDRQTLRDQLANAHVELHDLRTSIGEVEAERDELQAQLSRPENADDTTRFDRDKLELRRTATRLENEVKRLRDDRAALLEAKDTLEKQLGAEIDRATAEEGRLSAEIDRLQDKLLAGSGNRDRELTTAKTKVQRLERRIQELEALLQHQQPAIETEQSGTHGDLSLIRHSLDEARKREKILLQREAEQKASARTLKSRVADLERDLHQAMINKFDSHSPRDSPSNKLHEELRNLRKQLSDAHRSLKEIKVKNRDLERAAMKEEDQRDLHELLKSSTLEAEALALKVSERDSRLNELKNQLHRIREERAFCARKAESATKELVTLQQRYDEALKKVSNSKASTKGQHEKEMRGLGKEIIWLRARLRREEKFRSDLAWSKGLMELGERVRVAWLVTPVYSHLCIMNFQLT